MLYILCFFVVQAMRLLSTSCIVPSDSLLCPSLAIVSQGPGLLSSKAKKGDYVSAVVELAMKTHNGDVPKAVAMLKTQAAKKTKSDK